MMGKKKMLDIESAEFIPSTQSEFLRNRQVLVGLVLDHKSERAGVFVDAELNLEQLREIRQAIAEALDFRIMAREMEGKAVS